MLHNWIHLAYLDSPGNINKTIPIQGHKKGRDVHGIYLRDKPYRPRSKRTNRQTE